MEASLIPAEPPKEDGALIMDEMAEVGIESVIVPIIRGHEDFVSLF